jgi:hypothetical protein
LRPAISTSTARPFMRIATLQEWRWIPTRLHRRISNPKPNPQNGAILFPPARNTQRIAGCRPTWIFSCDMCCGSTSPQKETMIKNLMNIFFALSLLMSVVLVAQDTMKQDTMKNDASTKAVSVKGKISDDGKTFVSDKGAKSWTISNPEAIKGHEGHHVTLKAHVYADKNEVHVMSLKMAADSMKKDDMQK